MIIPVLLAGGSGNRLWPLSRELYPKQCINLTGGNQTLIQQTVSRIHACKLSQDPIIVCNNEHRFLIAQQLTELGASGEILLEPAARNTAAAVALAAFEALERSSAAKILVLPADHVIEDTEAFCEAIALADALADEGKLVTFGVVPSYPEPGYGYIEATQYGEVSSIGAFHEKPDVETAKKYLAAGNYYWNSGMFLFPARVFVDELKRFEPEIYEAVAESIATKYVDLDFIRAGESAFEKAPSVSVDVAVMERTDLGMVVPYRGDWNDVGSWSSVYDTQSKDENGNVVQGDVILHDTENSFVRSQARLVSAVGVTDLAIIDTPDALLVMNRHRAQDVKEVVAQLKASGRSEHRRHSVVYRPWGSVETVNIGTHYQVKHVMIKPGARIALQVHHHRAEHWIVVSGTAEVTVGDKTDILRENESVYIRVGDVHSLRNCGDQPLDIIEVQTGDCFGEDDVVRFTNNYLPGEF